MNKKLKAYLQNTLSEIGTKRANKDIVKAVVETVLKERLIPIGKFLFGESNTEYDVFESPSTGVLLSLYKQEMDEINLGHSIMISSSSYIGIISPSIELTNKIGKAIELAIDGVEISYPSNNYGGLAIDRLLGKKGWKIKMKLTKTPILLQLKP